MSRRTLNRVNVSPILPAENEDTHIVYRANIMLFGPDRAVLVGRILRQCIPAYGML